MWSNTVVPIVVRLDIVVQYGNGGPYSFPKGLKIC